MLYYENFCCNDILSDGEHAMTPVNEGIDYYFYLLNTGLVCFEQWMCDILFNYVNNLILMYIYAQGKYGVTPNIAKTPKYYNNHMTIKHHNNHFNISPTESFTPMYSFNCLGCATITPSIRPNYFGMSRKLSYDNVPLHTQDFLEMKELLRDFSDVLETSNPQTLGMH